MMIHGFSLATNRRATQPELGFPEPVRAKLYMDYDFSLAMFTSTEQNNQSHELAANLALLERNCKKRLAEADGSAKTAQSYS